MPSNVPLLTFEVAMAKVRFRLNNPAPEKLTSILVELYISRAIRPVLATGEHCRPENWDGSRVVPGRHGKPTKGDAANINRHLAQIEADLMELWRDNKSAGRDEIKALASELINGSPVQKKTEGNPVITWMREFVKQSKKKKGTAQVYNATIDHLEGYSKKKNISLTWESFDLDFYESFVDYLYGLKHNDNTVGKYIRKLKHLISEAFERNLHTNLSFKKKGFKAPSAEVDEIYLSDAEIIQFYNADLKEQDFPNWKELTESKMRFVFACWVGLRFGDLTRINPNQVQKGLNGPILKVVTQKTGEEVMIPFHPLAEEIWNYWQKNPPRKIDNPTFNEHIKTIAEKAGFTELVQKRNTIKGQVTVQWVKKFEMVKAHTARRSFATNCYLMGIPSRTIMAITGHRTEKAFLKYIRVTKDQHVQIMAGFFKNQGDITLMRKAQ